MTADPYPPLDARTIRSEEDRFAICRMIEVCRQDTEVAFRPGLEPEKCRCAAVWDRKIDWSTARLGNEELSVTEDSLGFGAL
jgi:hypothetical protein